MGANPAASEHGDAEQIPPLYFVSCNLCFLPRARRLYIRAALQAKVRAMGLLAQLFRHKNSPPGEHAPAPEHDAPPAACEVRGVGAVAVAAGVRTAHGMPAEFSLSLGEILSHLPGQFVRPGNHDDHRTLRIPAADVAPGLARGKGQVSLACLAALAPEVFRWEQGNLEAPQVR